MLFLAMNNHKFNRPWDIEQQTQDYAFDDGRRGQIGRSVYGPTHHSPDRNGSRQIRRFDRTGKCKNGTIE